MAKKLHGRINLSIIPKELILKDGKGNSVIWVDMIPVRDGKDQYGNTHTLTLWDKAHDKNIYLGNFTTQEFGKGGTTPQNAPQQTAPQQNAPAEDVGDDLPF